VVFADKKIRYYKMSFEVRVPPCAVIDCRAPMESIFNFLKSNYEQSEEIILYLIRPLIAGIREVDTVLSVSCSLF